LRAKLRARLPGLFEIVYVYENQDALVISYSPTEDGYEGLCSIGAVPRGGELFFGQGARCRSRIEQAASGERQDGASRRAELDGEFDRPEIEALMAAALNLAKVRLDASAKGAVILRAEAQKQRTRRAAKAARPASTRRTAKARR
jgi:hypothetical protein